MQNELTLSVGRVYRAKKPGVIHTGFLQPSLINDRVILHISEEFVQYDGPAVGLGRRFPRVTKEAFLKWAGQDVTDQLPKGKWEQAK